MPRQYELQEIKRSEEKPVLDVLRLGNWWKENRSVRGSPMHHLYIRVSEETYETLNKLAREKGFTRSTVARLAVLSGLENGIKTIYRIKTTAICTDCKNAFSKTKSSTSFRCEECQKKANDACKKRWKTKTNYKPKNQQDMNERLCVEG
jgi:DNA-directed RNA polymerase subunit RPC12/RpoP